VAPGQEKHPILQGIEPKSIFGTTDVYTVKPLPAGSEVLVLGEVTETLEPNSPGITGPKNNPMMPVAWTKPYIYPENGTPGRVFTTTMGGSEDLAHEGTRRLIVNGALWALRMDNRIPAKTEVSLVGTYKPTRFKAMKNEQWKPGKLPAAYDPLAVPASGER
jgi:type 1 glutamine amidotransferase